MKRKNTTLNRREFLAVSAAAGIAGRLQAQTTPRLAGFVVNANYGSLPPKAVETAKFAILDCLGVAVAGGREESAQIAGKLACRRVPTLLTKSCCERERAAGCRVCTRAGTGDAGMGVLREVLDGL